MTLRLSPQGAIIVSISVPPAASPGEVKNKFHEEMPVLMAALPKANKPIALGDFSVRAGTDHAVWENVLGPSEWTTATTTASSSSSSSSSFSEFEQNTVLASARAFALRRERRQSGCNSDHGVGTCWTMFSLGGETAAKCW
ncbi:hypothetical protein SprV_0100194900 [Sparganum proliferum]